MAWLSLCIIVFCLSLATVNLWSKLNFNNRHFAQFDCQYQAHCVSWLSIPSTLCASWLSILSTVCFMTVNTKHTVCFMTVNTKHTVCFMTVNTKHTLCFRKDRDSLGPHSKHWRQSSPTFTSLHWERPSDTASIDANHLQLLLLYIGKDPLILEIKTLPRTSQLPCLKRRPEMTKSLWCGLRHSC